jgi:SAM-dependent methyltransferase
MAEQRYDRIGVGYADRRRPDPRLAAVMSEALRDADSILNVGAGTSAYEPTGRRVVAVEPAIAMIRQRPASAAPVVRAYAEALPFSDRSFDSALAVLTIHHWPDWRAGVREMIRICRRRIVLFTWDPQSETSWLGDYFPQLIDADRSRFPTLTALRATLGKTEIVPVKIPHDCTDGFMGAHWRRPFAYLDPNVRSAISSMAGGMSPLSLSQLADDLSTGAWARKHGQVLKRKDMDLGYRLVVASVPSNKPLKQSVGRGRPPAA